MGFKGVASSAQRKSKRSTILVLLGVGLCLSVFQNCSKVAFSKRSKKEESSSGNNGNGGSTVPPVVVVPPGGYIPGYVPNSIPFSSSSSEFSRTEQGSDLEKSSSCEFQMVRTGSRMTASGLSLDSEGMVASGTHEQGGQMDVGLVFMSKTGGLRSALSIGGDGQEEVTAQTTSTTGSILAVGNVLRSTSHRKFRRDGLLVKHDKDLTTLHTFSAGPITKLSAVSSATETFVAGYSSDSLRGIHKSPILAQLDKNNNVSWSVKLNTKGSGEFLSVNETRDEVVAVGHSETSNFARVSALIARFSREGQLLQANHVSLGEETQALTSTPTRDGGLVVGGSVVLEDGQPETGFILRINANNQIEWAQVTEDQEKNQIQAVKESASGDLIAVGSKQSSTGIWEVQSFLLRANGDLVNGTNILEGTSSSFSGKALALDHLGQAQIAFNTASINDAHNPFGITQLGPKAASGCSLLKKGTTQLRKVPARVLASVAGTPSNGNLVRLEYQYQSENLKATSWYNRP